MKNTRPNNGAVLETKVDYIESKLDETISNFKEAITDLKEAIKDNKEAITKSESRYESRYEESRKEFRESMQQMENRHQAYFSKLETSLDKVVTKAESSRRWAIGTVISIAIAVIGSLVTFIIFLLNNGFQAPT